MIDALAGLVIIGLGLSGLWQAARDPRMDRAFWLRSLQVILGYMVFIAAGIMVMILLGVGGDTVHQLGLWGFLCGWFGLVLSGCSACRPASGRARRTWRRVGGCRTGFCWA